MTRFEDELKNALRRQAPPDGFADRVLARAAEQDSRPAKRTWLDSWLNIFAQPFAPANLLHWATVAAVAAALVVGGVHYRNVHVQRERAQGEAAKARLLLALRIAGSKLQLAKARVDQINSGQVNSDQRHPDPNSGPTANQQERE
jgi:cytochrome bd-type quinol oxidase subunit 1